MANINDIRHALQTAEERLKNAEDRLKIFGEGEEGQELKRLRKYFSKRARILNKEEKKMKKWIYKWEDRVFVLQKALIAFPAQTGNDFDFALEMQIEPILFLLLILSNLFLLLLNLYCRVELITPYNFCQCVNYCGRNQIPPFTIWL